MHMHDFVACMLAIKTAVNAQEQWPHELAHGYRVTRTCRSLNSEYIRGRGVTELNNVQESMQRAASRSVWYVY